MKLVDAIKHAMPFIQKSFVEQPTIEARLRMTMGISFWYLGEPAMARTQYERAYQLFLQHRGSDHPDTLKSLFN